MCCTLLRGTHRGPVRPCGSALNVFLTPAPFVAVGKNTCLPKIPTTGHARQSEFSCGYREIAAVTSRSPALLSGLETVQLMQKPDEGVSRNRCYCNPEFRPS